MYLLAQNAIPFNEIPKDFSPNWWFNAAVLMIVGVLVLGAIASLYFTNKSFRDAMTRIWEHVEQQSAQTRDQVKEANERSQQAHLMFAENLKTIVSGHERVAVSVDGLGDTIRDHSHKIDELTRKIT